MARPPKFRPEAFKGLSCCAKLAWYYIREHPGEPLSVQRLAGELGLPHATAHRALLTLLERGLLEELEPAQGSRPGRYRVRPPGSR
jgi:predicted transcriptional regulator